MPIGFHPIELLAILVVALLVFGPKKLPEMGSAIGKSIKEFKKGMNELTEGKDDDSTPFSAEKLAAIERELASKRAAEVPHPEAEKQVETETPEAEADTETKDTKETKVD
jgi:sec-independent protein translocase protein TatA